MKKIALRNVREHNLKGFDVEIPHNCLTVVTGVSGSGKSSLAFDTIYRESQRRFLATFSAKARLHFGKMNKPEAETVQGLYPALALSQRAPQSSSLSTVGTVSEVYDYLRLLYARTGEHSFEKVQASHFSFNSPLGACPDCNGLGIVDDVDTELLVGDEKLTIRQGALVPTTKSGYIVYSQVTMDVLDKVCRVHGFDVDTPWKELSHEHKEIIFWGSNEVTVPFGKHPLESRLKWKGITARPREEGYYKGIATTIREILKRNRTDNILRFARSMECVECNGSRLGEIARKVVIQGFPIHSRAELTLFELKEWLISLPSDEVTRTIVEPMIVRLELLIDLGLSHLSLHRRTNSLSAGELTRIRLASQCASSMNGVLYVLDEPTVGLHRQDMKRLLRVLRQLIARGNTVIVVEHERAIIEAADWIVDIGEGAGTLGGKLLFSGSFGEFLSESGPSNSPTRQMFVNGEKPIIGNGKKGSFELTIKGACGRNLQNIDVTFQGKVLNVVTGVPGAGKSTLIEDTLGQALRQKLHGAKDRALPHVSISNGQQFDKVVIVSQEPIGRTPRSNTATYTKLFDVIRTLFSATQRAKELALTKSHFSFNGRGGRCPQCEGTGQTKIAMHFLEDFVSPCSHCLGKRFNEEILTVQWNGKNINEVLEMTVREASIHFAKEEKAMAHLRALSSLGLDYMALGQPATTISGGEAQRIKLATELVKTSKGRTLYLLDEPTTGLHHKDVKTLLEALQNLVDKGNTVIVVEHDMDVISRADWIVELGPGSGARGGQLLYAGFPKGLGMGNSETAQAMKDDLNATPGFMEEQILQLPQTHIRLKEVRTNNLQAIDVSIPLNEMTVITGPSGSGKSSLAFDTLYAEGRRMFTEGLSTYARRFMKSLPKASLASSSGLTPTVAVGKSSKIKSQRSTVATMTGLTHPIRLLYSRFGDGSSGLTMSHLSFNHHLGACPHCHGLGQLTYCSREKLVTHPKRSLLDGALDGTKTGKFYGERQGQYVATLREVGHQKAIDFSLPFEDLTKVESDMALYGTGEELYSVCWHYQRGKREGTHQLHVTWPGFAHLVEEEYERKLGSPGGLAVKELMVQKSCPHCLGSRLSQKSGAMKWRGLALSELYQSNVSKAKRFFFESLVNCQQKERIVVEEIIVSLALLERLGLGYLTLHRSSPTLSGGEGRRIRLVNQLAGKLCGVTLVIDEPTIGLHAKDVSPLLDILEEIKELGNTLLVVEHERKFWQAADYIIELGPQGGTNGGKLIACGTIDELKKTKLSNTAKYLKGKISIVDDRKRVSSSFIEIKGASANNLKDLDVLIPKASLVAITGVSGSGKTSLLFDVLASSLRANRPIHCEAISGIGNFDRVFEVTNRQTASTPSSTPATYLSFFEEIRSLFSKTSLAKENGFKKGHFSYLNKAAQCPHCKGFGRKKVSLDFLADFYVTCEECQGLRYENEILAVEYDGLSIGAVLKLTATEACKLFSENKVIMEQLNGLVKVGLGYLRLGQALSTLSGGEFQRLQLLAGLKRSSNSCYLLDEPTRGLHPMDTKGTINLLEELVDEGNSVIVVEHDLDFIKRADWIIDLGPDGGPEGGTLVFSGSPQKLLQEGRGHTAEVIQSTYLEPTP